MSTSAGQLLDIWSFKLRMGRLSNSARQFVELLVAKLGSLDADEQIEIDAAENRRPLAKFIRVSTGEVLAELDGH